jgi:hypothetical protein
MHPKNQHFLNIVGDEPKNLDELGQSIIKFLNNNPLTSRFDRTQYTGAGVVGFKWDVRYNETVSNSHDCPLNGVTNWGNTYPDRPTSYPGFYGRVWIRYQRELDLWGSDPLREGLTYPGTGGAGTYGGPWEKVSTLYWKRYGYKSVGGKLRFKKPYVLSWDYRFYLDDWPLIQKYIENQQTFHQLQSKKFELKHVFEWYDEKTVERDKQLEEYIIKFPDRTKIEKTAKKR